MCTLWLEGLHSTGHGTLDKRSTGPSYKIIISIYLNIARKIPRKVKLLVRDFYFLGGKGGMKWGLWGSSLWG